jgi:hypothetical protein
MHRVSIRNRDQRRLNHGIQIKHHFHKEKFYGKHSQGEDHQQGRTQSSLETTKRPVQMPGRQLFRYALLLNFRSQ